MKYPDCPLRMKNRSLEIFLAFAGIFILIYCFEYLTPITTDDFSKLRMQGLADIWKEIFILRDCADGRIGAWFLVIWLLYIPHWLASALLALVFCLLIFFLCLHFLGMDWKNSMTWRQPLLALALVWLAAPAFGQVFFWRTGSYYGVSCAFFLVFLWPYRVYLEKGDRPAAGFLLLLPIALFLGLADYNTTLGVCLFSLALCLAAFYRQGAFSLLPLLPPALLLLCFYSTYSAPGTALRASEQGFGQVGALQGFMTYLRHQGEVQFFYAVPYILILLCGVIIWRKRSALSKGRAPNSGGSALARLLSLVSTSPGLFFCLFFFLLAQATQMAFAFAAIPSKRAYSSSVLFMIVAALCLYRFMQKELGGKKTGAAALPDIFLGLCALAASCSIAVAAYMFFVNKSYDDQCRQIAQSAPQGADLCFPPGPFRSDSYLFCGRSHQFQEEPEHWMNRAYAAHYGLGSVKLCPQNLTLLFAQSREEAGEVRDDRLFFNFTLPPQMQGKDFVFAFPPATRNPLRAWVEEAAARCCPDSALFRNMAHRIFWKATPLELARNGLTVTGTAKMPRVEHTDSGYIIFYEAGSKRPAKVPLLRLSMARQEDRPPAR